MSVKIKGNSKEIIEAIAVMGASPDKNKVGFSPLLLKITDGKVISKCPNTEHTAFMMGEFKFETEGEGDMVVDVPHVLSRLRKYFTGGDVTLEYIEKEGKFIISNDKKRSYSYPPAIGDTNFMEYPGKRDEKGNILFAGEKPTTRVSVNVSELKEIIDQGGEVDVDYYKLIFSKDGSESWVGDESDKTQAPMNMDIDCEVKGKKAIVQYSQCFSEVMGVLSGKIKMYMSTNTPLWIKYKTKTGKVEYVIAPRIDEE